MNFPNNRIENNISASETQSQDYDFNQNNIKQMRISEITSQSYEVDDHQRKFFENESNSDSVTARCLIHNDNVEKGQPSATNYSDLPIPNDILLRKTNEACQNISQPKRKNKKHKTDRLNFKALIDEARANKKEVAVFKTKDSLTFAFNPSEEYNEYSRSLTLENGKNQKIVDDALKTEVKLTLSGRNIMIADDTNEEYLKKKTNNNDAVRKHRKTK